MFSALSIILAIVLFIIQIPIKAIMLGLKASIATGKLAGKAAVNLTGTEEQADEFKERLQSAGQKASKVANTTKKTAKATVNTAKKTGKFAKKQLEKTPERIEKTARNTKRAVKMTAKTAKATGKLAVRLGKLSVKAVQLAIKALQFLLSLIKAIISLLLNLGIIGIVILVLIVIVLIVAILSAVLAVDSESTSSSGSYSSGGSGSADSGTGQEVIIDVDTSTLEASCETMAKWYIANVTTYQGGGKDIRQPYTCSILNGGQTVYDDCTGFSAAYASLVSGKKVEAYGSEQLYKGGQSYIDAGWTRYTIKDIGGVSGLVVGDILVCNKDADSNCKGHHAEIYLGSGRSFGWGKIQTKYPSSSATLIDSSKDGYIEDGGSHIYGVVYRYTGGS